MKNRQRESGNVLYYILIAVALLGALSYAVARGGRTSATSLTEDKQRLMVSEILDYSDAVKRAVTTLRLRNVKFEELSFASNDLPAGYGTYGTTPAHEIFNPGGAGVIYRSPEAAALDSAQEWVFTASNEIEDVGTTSGDDNGADLLMILPGVKDAVCLEINNRISVINPGGALPADTAIETATLFDGTPAYDKTVGDEDPELAGKMAGCFENGGGVNYFYQVLLAR